LRSGSCSRVFKPFLGYGGNPYIWGGGMVGGMKTIGVYTQDFSLYHDLLVVLKRRQLAYVSLSSLEDVPRRVGVILTSEEELGSIPLLKAVAVDAYESIDCAVDLALQKLAGKELYSRLFIGIDPGERPGIAVVGDDVLLQKTSVSDPGRVVGEVRRIQRVYPAKEVGIRIGHGSVILRNRIINSLIPLEIPIEIVDESRTTMAATQRFERDREAAAAIAMVHGGGRVEARLPLEPTRGAIRNVQRHSRQLTEGRFTISEEVALRVLRGELSLSEAVEGVNG
jgi:hypothetical protein